MATLQQSIADEETQVTLAGQLAVVQKFCHGLSHEAGWWKNDKMHLDLRKLVAAPVTEEEKFVGGLIVTQKLCLAHSEISEAMEGHRKGLRDDKLPQHSMLTVEIADAIIRLLDLAGAMNLPVPQALAQKLAYNATRADHKPEHRAQAGGKAY